MPPTSMRGPSPISLFLLILSAHSHNAAVTYFGRGQPVYPRPFYPQQPVAPYPVYPHPAARYQHLDYDPPDYPMFGPPMHYAPPMVYNPPLVHAVPIAHLPNQGAAPQQLTRSVRVMRIKTGPGRQTTNQRSGNASPLYTTDVQGVQIIRSPNQPAVVQPAPVHMQAAPAPLQAAPVIYPQPMPRPVPGFMNSPRFLKERYSGRPCGPPSTPSPQFLALQANAFANTGRQPEHEATFECDCRQMRSCTSPDKVKPQHVEYCGGAKQAAPLYDRLVCCCQYSLSNQMQ